jgi:hypothetical protein
MKILSLLSLVIVMLTSFVFAQGTAPGWKPGMTRQEYLKWKTDNIAKMRANQAQFGELANVEDRGDGLFYFPFIGTKFVDTFAAFNKKMKEEFEVSAVIPITELRATQIIGQREPNWNFEREVTIGYLVIVKVRAPTK